MKDTPSIRSMFDQLRLEFWRWRKTEIAREKPSSQVEIDLTLSLLKGSPLKSLVLDRVKSISAIWHLQVLKG